MAITTGEFSSLARPYAQAAFQTAIESDSIQRWSEGLRFLSVTVQDGSLKVLIDDPKLSRSAVTSLIQSVTEEHLDKDIANFARLLADNRRLSLVPAICELFDAYYRSHVGIVSASVRSALPLEEDELAALKTSLQRLFDCGEACLEVEVDEALIGGVVVKVNDRVIDSSIRGKLERLAQQLSI